ncbi:hypothetical protein A0H81_04838 [Grifola frondosa]|uniref:Uncharacterized protein n=1 Tax=Grifola frondosa TaxID=5627 RepID=A0A1C7ME82_GRIFR|nr:hypothetical protein A0H81_04838 [Grifola frondosa]
MDPPWNVYADQLSYYSLGTALWVPEPLTGDVQLGDVGFFQKGSFRRLFNTLDSSSVPEGMQTLSIQDDILRHQTPNLLRPEQTLCSRSVSMFQGDAELLVPIAPVVGSAVGAALRFKCMHDRGAVLTLKDAVDQEELLESLDVEDYIKQNHPHWVRYVRNVLRLDVRRENLVFVHGWLKTSQWALAAFLEKDVEGALCLEGQFSPLAGARFSIQGSQRLSRSVITRSGPQTMLEDTPEEAAASRPKNQCIFLQYYKVKRRLLLAPEVIKAAAEPTDLPGPEDEEDELPGIASDSADSQDFEIEDVPAPSPMYDPIDHILDYILKRSNAEFALASHLDVQRIFKRHEELPENIPEFLNSLSPPIHVDEGSNTATLSFGRRFESLTSGDGIKLDIGTISSLDEHEFANECEPITSPKAIAPDDKEASDVHPPTGHKVALQTFVVVKAPSWSEASLNLRVELVQPATGPDPTDDSMVPPDSRPQSGKRMIIPLWSLEVRGVSTYTVRDAGTNEDISEFHRDGLQINNLARFDLLEYWRHHKKAAPQPSTTRQFGPLVGNGGPRPNASSVPEHVSLPPRHRAKPLRIQRSLSHLPTPAHPSPRRPRTAPANTAPSGRLIGSQSSTQTLQYIPGNLTHAGGSATLFLTPLAHLSPAYKRVLGVQPWVQWSTPPPSAPSLPIPLQEHPITYRWAMSRWHKGSSAGAATAILGGFVMDFKWSKGENVGCNSCDDSGEHSPGDYYTSVGEGGMGDGKQGAMHAPEDAAGDRSSELPWTCTLTATSPARYQAKVATLVAVPHHPKAVALLKISTSLPSFYIERMSFRDVVVVPDSRDRYPRNAHPAQDVDHATMSLVMGPVEIKDVIVSTALWLTVREGLGGMET